MRKIFAYIIALCALFAYTSCVKEAPEPAPNAMYKFSIDGLKATFSNFSGYFDSYSWDFGDGDTSTSLAPSHLYKTKGVYLVTLTASKNGMTDSFTDTLRISGPSITIDGKFEDWEYVPYTFENTTSAGGTLTGVKTFYSPTHIFFLIEGTADMKLDPFQLLFDVDNNASSGYNATDWYPAGSGVDFKYEGNFKDWGDFSKHNGTPGWNFDWVSTFEGVLSASEMVNIAGVNMVEIAVKKDVFGPLPKSIHFGIRDITSSWGTAGLIPETTPSARLLPMQTAD